MSKKQKLHVKIGDAVTIISGFHKNETGEVIKINRSNGKILVKGINFKFKHVHHSNVKLNLKEVS
jgi:large subunit ribosomal protein L24